MNILKTRQPPAESLTPHITGEIVTIKIFMVMGFDHLWNSTKWVLVASFNSASRGRWWPGQVGGPWGHSRNQVPCPRAWGPFLPTSCRSTRQNRSPLTCTCVCARLTHTPLTFSKPIGSRDWKEAGKIFTSPEDPNLSHLIIKSDSNPGLGAHFFFFFFEGNCHWRWVRGRHLSHKHLFHKS